MDRTSYSLSVGKNVSHARGTFLRHKHLAIKLYGVCNVMVVLGNRNLDQWTIPGAVSR